MSSEIRNIIVPSISYFIAFFIAFSLLETFIILFLNRLMFHWWGFTVEGLTQSKELHGKKIRLGVLITTVLLIIALLIFTDFWTILKTANLSVKVLTLETLLGMILIYLSTTNRLPKLEVEKSIHKYLYIYLSIIVLVLTTILAERNYERYQDFINANVNATVEGVDKKIKSQEKSALIENFRKQLYQGGCEEKNYLEEQGGTGVKNFVYAGTSDDLARTATAFDDDPDPAKFFRGRVCTNGVETFLLTDHGRWYWVIDG